jgi:uncharacterized protein (TIGR02996 family)
MQSDVAFLEAIRNEPGSRAPVLVYSDWLQERGDPRGEFIQLQCQAARLTASNPRRLELEARARKLLFEYEAEWLGPLLEVVSNWGFRRGLIEWVTVEAEVFLAHAERWLPALPLVGLHLRKAHGHARNLARCPQLAHINHLFLGDNQLTDKEVRALVRSPHLRRLRTLILHSNRFGEEALSLIASSPSLRRLRELSLAHNRIEQHLGQLCQSPNLRRLRFLNLTVAFLDENDVQALANSPLLAQLRTLFLGFNMLPPGSLKTLVESPALANLRMLEYSMNDCSDDEIEALARSPHVANLHTLILDSNRSLGDATLRALANSPYVKNLRRLSLGPGNWTPEAIQVLGDAQNLPKLRCLHLRQQSQASHTLPTLLAGPATARLREVELEPQIVEPAGLDALATQPVPLRWRMTTLELGTKTASSWQRLVQQGSFQELTQLTLGDLPRDILGSFVDSEQLPRLRKLRLVGVEADEEQWHQFLTGPLVRQLEQMTLIPMSEQPTEAILKSLVSVANTLLLHRLDLSWSLTPAQVQLLMTAPTWPNLIDLRIGSFALGSEGMRLLAQWPLLQQLRYLTLSNSSHQQLPALEELARSPHVGPLLRIDINNASVDRNTLRTIREHMGYRFSAYGRKLPRVVTMGSPGLLFGDDE